MPRRQMETPEKNFNGLTQLEQKFCDEYLKTCSTTRAALACGYSKSYAAKAAGQLYKRPSVQTYLENVTAEMTTNAIATTQELQEELTKIVRRKTNMVDKVNKFVGGGVQEVVDVVREPNGKERLEAINMLAKMQGAYNKDINVNVKPVVIHDDI